MPYIGMLAFGIFVGGISTVGMKLITDQTGYIKILGTIISSVLGGVVFTFLGHLKEYMEPKDYASVFLYPVGLLVGLLWLYFPDVNGQTHPFVRWGGIVAIVLITCVAAALAIVPPFRSFVNS